MTYHHHLNKCTTSKAIIIIVIIKKSFISTKHPSHTSICIDKQYVRLCVYVVSIVLVSYRVFAQVQKWQQKLTFIVDAIRLRGKCVAPFLVCDAMMTE